MQHLFDLETYSSRLRLIGFIAIAISIVAWWSDLSGAVYVCPYCRTQRTVIGLLGVLLIMPNPRHWILRYIGAVVGFLGAVVASMQHFNGWKKISAGTFEFNERIYIDSFLLSGCALFIITALVCLLYSKEPVKTEETED
ncbi:disulfide bond formation protein B [Kordiimonas laminariae]|uniref:disulfide bond formation protein B n=1 Tax=Kordiimonas laminariae TaxID=2917717 RepID=UPI001FF68EBA|nr:disulfide bond formation protein B [Kordiimonas laminariae]MCK0069755.1 hypothetical protein [Kordiimonas laminariae]